MNVRSMKKSLQKTVYVLYDILLAPFSFIYLPLLKLTRRAGVAHFPLHRKLFRAIGIFPVRDHYYEPQFNYSAGFNAGDKRELPLDFAVPEQLEALQSLHFKSELQALAITPKDKPHEYFVHNPNFGPGDADLYYLLIRNCKPEHIIEIGSGFSTLLALEAIKKNKADGHDTQLTCIEPHAAPWLQQLAGIKLIAQPVEQLGTELFAGLQENDILFIDSSHIIRPENDVLFIYLQLLPVIRRGVLIHIHDIFSPRHYRHDWLTSLGRFWNEQYLLEAFLHNNSAYKILYSLNYLSRDFNAQLRETLYHISAGDEPSSFWLKKLKE